VALKEGAGKSGGWGKTYECCCVLWPLSLFRCISVVVVEGVCVKDCRGLVVCTVGTVG
jgi:hypothetical protein